MQKGQPVYTTDAESVQKGQPVYLTGYLDADGVFHAGPLPGGGGGGSETDPIYSADKPAIEQAIADVNTRIDGIVISGPQMRRYTGTQITPIADLTDGVATPVDAKCQVDEAMSTRFFISGHVTRTGGNNQIGTLNVQIVQSTATSNIVLEETFQIQRDLDTRLGFAFAREVVDAVPDDYQMIVTYSHAGAEVVSVKDAVISVDQVPH